MEIDVRWENVQDQITDSQSNLVDISAKVVVNLGVSIGSVLWLGALDDIATPPIDLNQVVGFTKTPDVKGQYFRCVLMLKRLGNTLPTIV